MRPLSFLPRLFQNAGVTGEVFKHSQVPEDEAELADNEGAY